MSDRLAGGSCHCCGSGEFAPELSAADFDTGQEGFDLLRCAGCGLVRTEPFLDDGTLGAYYARSYYGEADSKFLGPLESLTRRANRQRARSILSRIAAPRDRAPRVLDVGCGRGALLAALSAEGCEGHGVERPDFPHSESEQGFSLHRQALPEIGFETDSFDAAILWHTLEHFTAAGETLAELSRIVAPGGLLFVAVPNYGSWQARWFGVNWFHLDLPRHLHHFEPATLATWLGDHGFTIETQSTLSLEQNLYGFVQSILNRISSGTPNRLYAMLRAGAGQRPWLAFLGQAAAAGLLAPLALLETLCSVAAGRGATLIVTARRETS